MVELTEADTIRILVATDSHVGYGERDPTRKDDSWKSFDEVMRLAKDHDVDMVLLAGDLFHENNPSRQALYQVMRSLRMNCLGERPCELEMLSDKTEVFQGAFDHVNYEDPDINVSIPVFSIHGNHDDPSGTGHLASLDILQMGGLVNYYGRTDESDNINVKPVLLQKGHTKLALYGMSNVRDERLFRTFRDNKVKFYRPGTQSADWFNIFSVHQNHHAYTETGYLKEDMIPDFMDLVVWGHEHECKIEPTLNPETGFYVMQPGSSVATSLVQGEAVPKHVSIVTISGRDFSTESIRLKTVRPFIYEEMILGDDKVAKKLAKKENNRAELTRRLTEIVEDLIEKANQEWRSLQDDEEEVGEPPLPLIRLRVEFTPPEGGAFDVENAQRFSNRFFGRVANVNDVVQFHRKKGSGIRRPANGVINLPDESVTADSALSMVKVEKLVKEFLTAQNLTVLPHHPFNDAVAQFIEKDDKHAMELFVTDSLKTQVHDLLKLDEDEDLDEAIEANKTRLEELFAQGRSRRPKRTKVKPKPSGWNSELDGNWSDDAAAIIHSDEGENEEQEEEDEIRESAPATSRGRGRGRGRGGSKASSTRKTTTTTTKRAAPAKTGRSRKKVEESEEEDIIMLDDEDGEDESQSQLFIRDSPPRTRNSRATASKVGGTQTRLTQTKLNPSRAPAVSQGSSGMTGIQRASSNPKVQREASPILDSDDDDDDAFDPAPVPRRRGR